MKPRTACVIVMSGAALALAGCAGNTSGPCVSWVDYATPEEALEDADTAIIGTIEARDGTEQVFGIAANAWSVRVDEVLVGTVDGDEVRVVSTPVTCTGGETYAEGDPFEAAAESRERVAVLMNRADGVLRTITPFDGIHPAEAFGR